MFFQLIILIASIGSTSSDVLTYEENGQRLENCGKEAKFESYYFQLEDENNKKDGGFAISPRHLLFPAHPLLDLVNKKWYRRHVQYDPATQCTNGIMKMDKPIGCTIKGNNVTIEKMVFIGTDCNENTYPRGVVVMEFSSFNWNPPYICLSGNSLPDGSNVTVLEDNQGITMTDDKTARCSTQNDICTSKNNSEIQGVAKSVNGIWNLMGTSYRRTKNEYSFIDWKILETKIYEHTGISNTPPTTTPETTTAAPTTTTTETVTTTVAPSTKKEAKNDKDTEVDDEDDWEFEPCPYGYWCFGPDIFSDDPFPADPRYRVLKCNGCGDPRYDISMKEYHQKKNEL